MYERRILIFYVNIFRSQIRLNVLKTQDKYEMHVGGHNMRLKHFIYMFIFLSTLIKLTNIKALNVLISSLHLNQKNLNFAFDKNIEHLFQKLSRFHLDS